MANVLKNDRYDSFTLGCALLIMAYVLGTALLVAQYSGSLR